jgi:hypothetical protein
MSDQKKFRITLWEVNTSSGTTGGWRGTQKAVVFDASAIGVEENANDVGSAFWTLPNNHPQIAEFVPLARHYEISRWSEDRTRWEFVGAGILNDYSVTEWETTFQGIDYKALLNMHYTPLNAMSVTDASPLNKRLSTDFVYAPEKSVFTGEASSSVSSTIFLNTDALSVGPLKIFAFDGNNTTVGSSSEGIFINDPDGTATYWKTPMIRIDYSLKWISATTSGFDTKFYLRLYASPPASNDLGEPPLINSGLIGEWTSDISAGSLTNGAIFDTEVSFAESIYLATRELEDVIEAAGLTFTSNPNVNDNATMVSNVPNPLRTGVSYSFQLYAAIKRTSTGLWYRSEVGSISGATDTTTLSQVTVGQSTKNASSIITSMFTDVTTSDNYNRLRYSTISVSGSTATTHTTFTAGEPVLDFIGNICDMEMGAKTNSDKVVFGINRPTGGASYDGTFKLNLSVSSAASTALALRYPENIRSFSFTPGYSRVRNDIKVIPTTGYLAGSNGQNTNGTNIIGATAIDQASISVNGKITLLATKDNLLNAAAAQNEANRLLNTYKVANSKQVGIRAVLDGIDLWNGWDVGDSVRVTINQGLAAVDEPFVIAGVRWFGESDGHERIELDLVQGSAFAAAYTAPPITTAT